MAPHAEEAKANESTYTVGEEPLGTVRPIRVICIGGGASGINFARKAQVHMKETEFVAYEKNEGIGGTWFENRYPGCKCDIPSHNYQFAWAPNPNWSELFSPQEEILEYLENVLKKYDLAKYIKTSHKVVGATWDELAAKWIVDVEKTKTGERFTDTCDFLLNAGGILNAWKWPSIPGLDTFKGKLVHSAHWPKDWDYKGLKVALIGNGSSGIQVLPEMQKDVEHMTHIIRSPTWVTPGAASRYPSLRNGRIGERFSEEQKEIFRTDPDKYMTFRKQVEVEINSKFRMLVNDSDRAKLAREDARKAMLTKLGGTDLAEKIIPEFPVGCRRITPSFHYLDGLTKPNVRVIFDERIERIVENGLVMSDGEFIEIDALVCATGFDVSFTPRFPIIGRNGISLGDVWKQNIPRAYLSMAIPHFPNYFRPSAPISHGSVFTITEQCSKYVIQIISKLQTEGIKTIDVKEDALRDFAEHVETFMPHTAWAAKCRSWFKNGTIDGPVIAIHPGSRIHFFHALEHPKFEDFEYTYSSKNRFKYLGNGFSNREEEGEEAQTWYFDHPDRFQLYY